MRNTREAVAELWPARDKPAQRHLMVLKETPVEPVLWDPRPHGRVSQPTIFGHFVDSLKKRMRMSIDGRIARVAIPTLRTITEQAKLAVEYQTSLNALSLAEVEREVRLAEIEQKKLELASQRRQHQALEGMRLQKEQLSLQKDHIAFRLEIATLRRQLKEQRQPAAAPKPTPAQQKLIKRAEVEAQLEELRAEEAKALQRATSELEKRRFQNMYTHRRDRLMEELEKYL